MPSMTQKVAYIWGPISSFSGPLAAWLVTKGWQVHVATKSALNVLSLSPLDLQSSALALLEEALGSKENFRTFQDRLKLVDESETPRGTKYDVFIFCGLPPNFDESRAPRAPWAADRLPSLMKMLKGVPTFLVSSVWGGIQSDAVVPEEFEFQRRKAKSHWENICQNYESKLLENLSSVESPWYLVRIPMVTGASDNGSAMNFSGLYNLFKAFHNQAQSAQKSHHHGSPVLALNHNPDATLWFLPVDVAVNMFWRFLEDENRPRICNLVSTQVTLNREWLTAYAQATGHEEVAYTENDHLNIPGVLRKLLQDNLQVRTRNLFEVASRYQLTPVKLNREYFERVLKFADKKGWGIPVPETKKKVPLNFSERLAQFYFENYLPSHFNESFLKKATTGGISVGFVLKNRNGLGWVLKSDNGEPVVEPYMASYGKPSIIFHFTGTTMTKLIQSKLPLHRALLMREVEIEGPLLDALRVTNVFDKFLKENPMDSVDFASVEED